MPLLLTPRPRASPATALAATAASGPSSSSAAPRTRLSATPPPARRSLLSSRCPAAPPTLRRASASTRALAAGDGAPLRVVVTGGTKGETGKETEQRQCTDRPNPVLLRLNPLSSHSPPSSGIGRALCEAFLAAGDDVVFCSRDGGRVAAAEAELKGQATRPGQVVAGFPCDVSAPGSAATFASSASTALGNTIDVWINNAGCTTYAPVMDAGDEETAAVVTTNLLGTLLASKAALRVLASQPTGGHLWNMDGAGSDGMGTPNFAAYGASKAALTHLHKSLKSELKSAGLDGKVGLHRLSPGMVTTDLLMAGAGKTPASNFFINVLAEAPVDSAAFLVPRVREVARSPPVLGRDGATVAFLTKPKALGQLLGRLVTGARKGKWVPE